MITSIFHLQLSASSESDSSNRPGCDSDGEFSVASSYGSDCSKRKHQPQIQGSAWVLRFQITMDQLHSYSDSMAGPEGDVENEDRITKISTRLQGLFGAQFEILIGKLHGNLMYLWFSATRSTVWIKNFPAVRNDSSDCACKFAVFVACVSFWLMGAL